MKLSKIRFNGPLANEFSQFVEQLETIDGNHNNISKIIRRFDRFLVQAYPAATVLTKDILFNWFSSFAHLKTGTQQVYRGCTFRICMFLQHRNPLTAGQEDFVPLKRNRFKPYIFSKDEIVLLLQEVRKLSATCQNPIRPWSYELIITILYTAGLRIREIIRLKIRDYDPADNTLLIRETKFKKSRLVPLSKSAQEAVSSYLNRRRNLGLPCEPENSLIWPSRLNEPSIVTVRKTLCHLFRQCGLKPAKGNIGPRPHDFRHSHAVHRILQWYQEGKDVSKLLPFLSVYMGHNGIASTQIYLTFIPDVLQEASKRFAKFAEPLLKKNEVKK